MKHTPDPWKRSTQAGIKISNPTEAGGVYLKKNMDYEKKYKEALERAKKFYDELAACRTKQKVATIFPELRESEDERIKRCIADCVGWFGEDSNMFSKHNLTQKQVLAWLEKQKEPIPIPNKFSGLKSLMLQYLQSAANRKDDSEIESDTDLWGRKILDYVWKYDDKQKELPFVKDIVLGYPGLYFYDGERMHFQGNPAMDEKQKEQKSEEPGYKHEDYFCERCQANAFNAGRESVLKEQKPTEWSEEEKDKVAQYLHDMDGGMLWSKATEITSDILDILRPQLKQEWTDEDDRICHLIMANLSESTRHAITLPMETVNMFNNWLRTLQCMPPLFTDWTDEDETLLSDALACVTMVQEIKKRGELKNFHISCAAEELRSWIRSLKSRPRKQPHWKPTEEQMEALDKAIPVCMGVAGAEEVAPLESLYEQLKKL